MELVEQFDMDVPKMDFQEMHFHVSRKLRQFEDGDGVLVAVVVVGSASSEKVK